MPMIRYPLRPHSGSKSLPVVQYSHCVCCGLGQEARKDVLTGEADFAPSWGIQLKSKNLRPVEYEARKARL